jgi:hypothetical protein
LVIASHIRGDIPESALRVQSIPIAGRASGLGRHGLGFLGNRNRPPGSLEPRRCLEPLENRLRFDQQRLHLLDAVVTGQPLGVFKTRDGEIKRYSELMKQSARSLEQTVGTLGISRPRG